MNQRAWLAAATWMCGCQSGVIVGAHGDADAQTMMSMPDGGTTIPAIDGGPPPPANGVFHEPFDWTGDPSATASGSNSSGVFWNPDDWDVRGDTDFLCGTISSDVLQTGWHVEIVKAASTDLSSTAIDASGTAIGGDGSAGIGVMRIDEQAIVSARLRNPMVLTEERPGIVRFRAPRFITTGHWWEISISPASAVMAAEFSPVPGDASNCHPPEDVCDDGLPGPGDGTDGDGTAGPGMRPASQAINLASVGWPDIPECDGNGWHYRFGVKAQFEGNTTQSYWNPVVGSPVDQLPVTSPAELDTLFAWRIEYRPSGIDLFADFNQDGSFVFHEHFAVPIPWNEVHVHFLGVAYQADHHPQVGCGFQGTVREVKWRDISVEPVRFAHTSIAPREHGTDRLPRTSGWMSYDLRDTQRFGAPVSGLPQANDIVFSRSSSLAYTSFAVQDAPSPVTQIDLDVDLDANQAAATEARFVYDIRYRGGAMLTVNGTQVGALEPATTVRGAATPGAPIDSSDWSWMWVRHSLQIDPSLLHVGTNHVTLTLTDPVQLDRMQLEFGNE